MGSLLRRKAVRLPGKPMRIIKAGEIRQYYSMKHAIDAMERAFSSLSSGDCHIPMRVVTRLPASELLMLYKPAFVEKDRQAAVKFITQREGSSIQGKPAIQGVVMVIDSVTGEIMSIMDGGYITALRTGAASGLATRLLAAGDAHTLALFGCGRREKLRLRQSSVNVISKKSCSSIKTETGPPGSWKSCRQNQIRR